MRRLNTRGPRVAGLLALALGVVALLAMSGVAAAKDGGGDNGHHGRHHHHHHHRQIAIGQTGTISSFDATTGKLTIALTGGNSVTGMVTEGTRIDCEGFDDRGVDRRDHGGGDNQGGQVEPGDDNGGQNEPGDDHGGRGANEGTPPPGQACTTESLVPGATVAAAELRLEGGDAVFTEIELGDTEATTAS